VQNQTQAVGLVGTKKNKREGSHQVGSKCPRREKEKTDLTHCRTSGKQVDLAKPVRPFSRSNGPTQMRYDGHVKGDPYRNTKGRLKEQWTRLPSKYALNQIEGKGENP